MKKLIIHLGLHRAASTALQNYLDISRAGLLNEDVALLVPRDLRGLVYKGHFTKLKNHHALSPRGRYLDRRLRTLLHSIEADTVVISEENLIGTMPGQSGAISFYPKLDRFLSVLSSWRGDFDIHPRLILRAQDKWVESLYAFLVFRGLRASFQHVVGQLAPDLFNWLHLRRALETHGLWTSSRTVVLETIKGKTFKDWIPGFFDLSPEAFADMKPATNESMLLRDLKLFWALNQIGWAEGDRAARRALRKQLAAMSHIHSDRLIDKSEVKDYLIEAGLALDDTEFSTVAEAYGAMPSPKFSERQRAAFMAPYEASNKAYFA